jgi:hypothetical protein
MVDLDRRRRHTDGLQDRFRLTDAGDDAALIQVVEDGHRGLQLAGQVDHPGRVLEAGQAEKVDHHRTHDQVAREEVDAVKKQAEDERQRGGCAKECKNREKDERIARTALAATQTNRAATIRAADLDAKIAAAEEALDRVDIKAVTMVADPQSASMASAIGADQNLIAALSHAVFAISIELGSGVGFWLVFGHGASSRRRLETEPTAGLVHIDRSGAVDLQAIDEKPQDIIERFFFEAVRPRQSVAVWSAYKVWCAQRGYSPVSHAMFGRLARWRKDRRAATCGMWMPNWSRPTSA